MTRSIAEKSFCDISTICPNLLRGMIEYFRDKMRTKVNSSDEDVGVCRTREGSRDNFALQKARSFPLDFPASSVWARYWRIGGEYLRRRWGRATRKRMSVRTTRAGKRKRGCIYRRLSECIKIEWIADEFSFQSVSRRESVDPFALFCPGDAWIFPNSSPDFSTWPIDKTICVEISRSLSLFLSPSPLWLTKLISETECA